MLGCSHSRCLDAVTLPGLLLSAAELCKLQLWCFNLGSDSLCRMAAARQWVTTHHMFTIAHDVDHQMETAALTCGNTYNVVAAAAAKPGRRSY